MVKGEQDQRVKVQDQEPFHVGKWLLFLGMGQRYVWPVKALLFLQKMLESVHQGLPCAVISCVGCMTSHYVVILRHAANTVP